MLKQNRVKILRFSSNQLKGALHLLQGQSSPAQSLARASYSSSYRASLHPTQPTQPVVPSSSSDGVSLQHVVSSSSSDGVSSQPVVPSASSDGISSRPTKCRVRDEDRCDWLVDVIGAGRGSDRQLI